LVKCLAQHKRYSVHGLTTWAIAVGLIISSATYVLLLVEQSARMIAQVPPSFRDGREIDALRWLDDQVQSDDVILASYATSNFLPTVVNAHTFTGHGPETAYSDDKRQLAAEFFAAQTTAAWRSALVRRWPIDWVVVGPLETQSGVVDLSAIQDVSVVYDQHGYRVYRIKR
jgi:hypothetical protein